MSFPKIGFNSYVDIATSMALQDTGCKRLKCPTTDDDTSTGALPPPSDWNDSDLKIHSPDILKTEWTIRIREWQNQFPNGGRPISEWTSLEDFEFGAFFLQKPLSAMPLWGVRQAFYVLDRLVCCKSEADLERVAKWELLPTFAYLEANKVEKSWRASLQRLGKEIQDGGNAKPKHPNSIATFASASPGLKDRLHSREKDHILRNMPRILSGITKLEDAQKELRRTWKTYLEGAQIRDLMLEKIRKAAEMRFSMITTYLKTSESGKGVERRNGSADAQISSESEPKPRKLVRSNSLKVVKRELASAWVSTERGDGSPAAIAILLLLLMCLTTWRRDLITRSEMVYDI